MPQIDFYLLPEAEFSASLRMAALLAAKCQQAGQNCDLLLASEHWPEMQEQLWQAKPDSFLPCGDDQPVRLCSHIEQLKRPWCLNLGSAPLNLGHLGRIFELVGNSPDALALGRDKWRAYTQLGFKPNKHQL